MGLRPKKKIRIQILRPNDLKLLCERCRSEETSSALRKAIVGTPRVQ